MAGVLRQIILPVGFDYRVHALPRCCLRTALGTPYPSYRPCPGLLGVLHMVTSSRCQHPRRQRSRKESGWSGGVPVRCVLRRLDMSMSGQLGRRKKEPEMDHELLTGSQSIKAWEYWSRPILLLFITDEKSASKVAAGRLYIFAFFYWSTFSLFTLRWGYCY